MHAFIGGFLRLQTLILGLFLLGLSVMLFRDLITFTENKVKTVGVVVDHSVFRTADKHNLFRSVVAFRDRHQRLYHVASRTAYKTPAGKGELVSVYYDPDRPQDAWVDGDTGMVIAPAIALLAALFCFAGLLAMDWERYRPFLAPLLTRLRQHRKTRHRKKRGRTPHKPSRSRKT